MADAAAQPTVNNPVVLQASHREPRAYGYQLGDVLRREVLIQVPAGLALDETSLPIAGGRGQALELRAVRLQVDPVPGGLRQWLRLDYQVFFAPREVRTLEIAPFTLQYLGQPRDQTLRIEAWPVTVAPLLPLAVSPRQGLGELQPDLPPPLIEVAPRRQRLTLWTAGIIVCAAWLGWARLAWPWWQRRYLPFGQAWARLRRLPDAPDPERWRDACRSLHQALNQSAGHALFEAGLADWVGAAPAYAALQAELARFLRQSQQLFFAIDREVPRDGAWLRGLSRRCCEAERR